MSDPDQKPAPAAAPHPQAQPAAKPPTLYGSARAVTNYCLLPDPRPWYKRSWDYITTPWRSMHYQSEQQCANDEIKAVAMHLERPMPAQKSVEYQNIMKRAHELADLGVSVCHVRDFHDTTVVPKAYYGYRGADHQCHVTQDKSEAATARAKFKQTR